MSRSPRSQRGVALIMVLLAAALAATLAAGMLSQQSLMIERASHHMGQQQARSLALGAEVFARQVLYRDWEEGRRANAPIDHGMEPWSRYAATLPVEAGVVEVQINDLQGRLNLNDLVSAQGGVDVAVRDRFARLLEVLEINSLRVEQLIDWIDPDEQPIGAYGGEDGEYLGLTPAYRAANRPFVHISELRLLAPITVEDYRKLLPHVAALPLSGQGLNVNMATVPVLQSFHADISQAEAESVATAREAAAFGNTQDFLARPEFAALGLKADGLSVQTQFFEVATQVSVGGRVYRLVSVLHRSNDGLLTVVARDAGQDTIITKDRVTAD